MTTQPPAYPGGNDFGGTDFGGMPPYATPVARRTSGMCIAALVLGIVSIPGSFIVYGVLGLILGVLAVIFAILGIRSTRRPEVKGRGLAIAGLVCGIVGFLISLFLFLFSGPKARDCQRELGPGASRDQLSQCIRDKMNAG